MLNLLHSFYCHNHQTCLDLSGGKGKKWKKRFLVLDGDKMEYFTKEGAGKVHGTINLSEGRGVREMGQCQCKWPKGVTEELGFGLAMESRTFYFHAVPEEGSVRYVCVWC